MITFQVLTEVVVLSNTNANVTGEKMCLFQCTLKIRLKAQIKKMGARQIVE